jgi:hypothetical protein
MTIDDEKMRKNRQSKQATVAATNDIVYRLTILHTL